MTGLEALLLAAGASLLAGAGLSALRPRVPLLRANHRDRLVPAVLGLAWAGGLGVSLPAAEPGPSLVLLASAGALALAGLADDLGGPGPRGFAGHLRSLRRGRPTTGILKLLVGVGAGIAVALAAGGGPVRVAATAVLAASSANVANALDVRPGRALKAAGLVLAAALPTLWGSALGVVVAAALGAALGVLPLDLRERGMLGDAGSNPLGFVAGAALAAVLATPWLVAAAVVALALQVAAETVTITRLIEASPPLAWLDRLGRVAG